MAKEGSSGFIYEELSYKITGALFEVYNELGPGYREVFCVFLLSVYLYLNL